MRDRPLSSPFDERVLVQRREVRLREEGDLGGRLPPAQVVTRGWPVVHDGEVPRVDPAAFRLSIGGLVASPFSLAWEELLALGVEARTADLHCVRHFTTLDNAWEGVPVARLLARAAPLPEARYVLQRAHGGYEANVPLADFARPANLLAVRHGGLPLAPEHGGPCRVVIPHLYAWKGAKWIASLTFLAHDEPGSRERRGYHMRGDAFAEERFRED